MLICGEGTSLLWALPPSPSHQELRGSDWESLANQADPPGPWLAVPGPAAPCLMAGAALPSPSKDKSYLPVFLRMSRLPLQPHRDPETQLTGSFRDSSWEQRVMGPSDRAGGPGKHSSSPSKTWAGGETRQRRDELRRLH